MEKLTKREQRVIKAFINCVLHGEFTEDYAITLIEDQARYGWLSEAAKETFYEELDKLHPVEPEAEAVIEEQDNVIEEYPDDELETNHTVEEEE